MIKRYIFFAVSVLAAGILRALLINTGTPYHTFLSVEYIFICLYWLMSVKRRFLNDHIRRALIAAAYLMVCFILLKLIRYDFAAEGGVLSRYLWYAYYIPVIFCPCLMLIAAGYTGHAETPGETLLYKFLLIPAALIVAAVMTNDIHNSAFRFSDDYAVSGDYTHGAVYYAAIVFTALIFVILMTVLFRNMRGKRFLYRMRITLPVTAVGIIYVITYSTSDSHKALLQTMYEMPEFFCIFFISFWESLVITHAVPTNSEYSSFFRASSIKAGLTDENYKVAIKSANGVSPLPEQIKAAENKQTFLDDGVTLLKSTKVPGGHFYWTEDTGELVKLNEQLKETGDYLEEERAMLNEAARLEEQKKRTSEQNRLFDGIAKSLKPQLDRIEEILNGLPDDEAGFCREMKYAGVLGAYVKRYSNLLLLSDAESRADSSELFLCINESFVYLRLLGAFCCADVQPGIELPLSYELLMYELFEAVTESAFMTVSSMFVTLKRDERGLTFYVEAAALNAAIDKSFYEKAESAGFTLETAYSDGCFFAVLNTKEAII